MIRMLQWAAVILVVYFVVTEALPWIRGRVEGVTHDKILGKADGTGDDASTCVRLAHQANAVVADEIRNAVPPPGDSTAWVNAGQEISRRINEAQDYCACDSPACATALDALDEISSLVEDMDLMISGEGRFAGGLVQRQERIDVLLEQSRVEAR